MKNIKKSLLLLYMFAFLTGCKKIIDYKPKDNTYNEIFWNSGTNAEKALAGAYGLFRSALEADGSHFVFGDLPTDEFILGGDFWNYTSLVPSGNFVYSYTPYLPSLSNWSRFYGVINQCHMIIENVPNIPDNKFNTVSYPSKTKNVLMGNALFMRAYTYFYMTRVWGDVILTTESLKDPLNVPSLGRTKESEVLDYCIADLQKAITLLEYSDDKSVASKGAAWALLAHIYAWKHDYPNALTNCNNVINSNDYSLETADTYKNIWQGNSTESLFEINMKYNAVSNEATDYFFSRFLYGPYIKDKESHSAWMVNPDVAFGELYTDTADIRLKTIISDPNSSEPMLLKYNKVNYYDPNAPSTYVVDNNLVMLRLADIYLLKAEAAFKTGDETTALEALNVVKDRAAITASVNTGADLWDEILEERRRELIGEGVNAYDFIRMEKLGEYFSAFTPDRIEKKGYYWPLDMRTLLPQAPLLTQNEWWKNH